MTFDVAAPDFKLGQLLALELHRFEEEVSARAGQGGARSCSAPATLPLDQRAQACQRPSTLCSASMTFAPPAHSLPPPTTTQVAEIVDRAQKEEKMEGGLAKLEDTWGRVAFNFAPHKEGSDVSLVKMAEEDFEVRRGPWC